VTGLGTAPLTLFGRKEADKESSLLPMAPSTLVHWPGTQVLRSLRLWDKSVDADDRGPKPGEVGLKAGAPSAGGCIGCVYGYETLSNGEAGLVFETHLHI
jgi:hypothetical protein